MQFHQVDISEKPVVLREATATGRIRLKRETIARIKKRGVQKGDPLALAAVSSVLGAKQTPIVIALAHLIRVEKVEPSVSVGDGWVGVTVKVTAHEKTGVEMEALTAVSFALLNVWDAVKQYEKDGDGQYPSTAIESIRVTSKDKGAR